MQEKNNNLSIPMAIIAAGIIIALGIYLTNTKSNNTTPNPELVKAQSINIKPISSIDHIKGNPDAPIAIVEFSDEECPFCKMFHPTMQTIMNTYGKDGKVAWVYRHFPLDQIHPKTRKEAEATECANELGGNDAFWKYIDELYATTTSNNTLDPLKLPIIAKNIGLDVKKFNECLSSGKYASLIQSQLEDAMATGAQGTPYSVMILKNPLNYTSEKNINDFISTNQLGNNVSISGDKKGIVLNGALPLQIVQQIIDMVLK